MVVFHVEAVLSPEDVWPMLTDAESTRAFLFGIALEADWVIGSPVTGWLGGSEVMCGEVLFAERPTRLSYVLAAGPGHPEVYVTWEIAQCPTGASVRLCLDEVDDSDGEEVEAAWQPVVTALRAVLSVRAT